MFVEKVLESSVIQNFTPNLYIVKYALAVFGNFQPTNTPVLRVYVELYDLIGFIVIYRTSNTSSQ